MYFILFIITILSGIAGVASYIAGYVPPTAHYFFGLLAMSSPLWIGLNGVLLVFWVFKKWKNVFFPLITLLIISPNIYRSYGFNEPNKVNLEDDIIKIISYNVQVFNRYNYDTSHDSTPVDSMVGFLIQEDADVICLQEYYTCRKGNEVYNIDKRLKKAYPYAVREIFLTTGSYNDFGQVILSKHPIVYSQKLKEKRGGNFMFYADIKKGEDIIRIYSAHLASISLSNNVSVDIQKSKSSRLKVLSKIRNGFELRTKQVKPLVKSIQDCPYPLIVCADLNDVPYSYAYNHINSHLANAFEVAGSDFGITYNSSRDNKYLFFLRIDNQFFSDKNLRCLSLQTKDNMKQVDHFPLVGLYKLKKKH